MYFQLPRDTELSVIYYLETQIAANWTGISVVKSFANAYKSPLPVVAIRLGSVDPNRLQIGDVTLNNDYIIDIDVFGNSDGQKTDLSYFIFTKLNEGCVFYNHSQTSGAPETLTRTANGRLYVSRFIDNRPLDFGQDVDKYDQHRWAISVAMKKSI